MRDGEVEYVEDGEKADDMLRKCERETGRVLGANDFGGGEEEDGDMGECGASHRRSIITERFCF